MRPATTILLRPGLFALLLGTSLLPSYAYSEDNPLPANYAAIDDMPSMTCSVHVPFRSSDDAALGPVINYLATKYPDLDRFVTSCNWDDNQFSQRVGEVLQKDNEWQSTCNKLDTFANSCENATKEGVETGFNHAMEQCQAMAQKCDQWTGQVEQNFTGMEGNMSEHGDMARIQEYWSNQTGMNFSLPVVPHFPFQGTENSCKMQQTYCENLGTMKSRYEGFETSCDGQCKVMSDAASTCEKYVSDQNLLLEKLLQAGKKMCSEPRDKTVAESSYAAFYSETTSQPTMNNPNNTLEGPDLSETGNQTAVIQMVKDWTGDSPTPISDFELLKDMGSNGTHIPPWFANNAKWFMKGEITQEDFEESIRFMDEKGVLR